jgi:hypothetical protein
VNLDALLAASQVTWYAARASGLVGWAVVTASILWGLALSTRLVRRRGASAWMRDLHRFLGTLSLVFVAVHLAALVADNYVYFGPGAMLVPMASPWRPGPVAWGIAGAYLLVAIQVTSWTMRWLPRRLWHAVHLASFPMFVAVTVHGFTAGADNRNLAVQWAALTGAFLVVFLLLFRMRALEPAEVGLAPYLTRRESRRSASTFPPV